MVRNENDKVVTRRKKGQAERDCGFDPSLCGEKGIPEGDHRKGSLRVQDPSFPFFLLDCCGQLHATPPFPSKSTWIERDFLSET